MIRNKCLALFAVVCFLLMLACSDDDSPKLPPLTGMIVIDMITTGTNLSVYTAPVVTFHREIDKGISLATTSEEHRPVLDAIKLYSGDAEIPGAFTMVDGRTAKCVALQPLPAESTIKVEVTVHWEKFVNGAWTPATGESSTQRKEATFTTGKHSSPAEIITGIFPIHGAVNQSVVTYPLITFKKSFEAPVLISESGVTYRPVLDETALLNGSSKVAISTSWNSTRDSLYLRPEAILHTQTTYKIQVKHHWEVQHNQNWIPFKQGDQVFYDITEASFTTGMQADLTRVLPDNIAATYPVEHQYFFLQAEYPQGYIMLKTSLQNSLIKPAAGEKLEVRLSSPGKTTLKSFGQFDEISRTLSYNMPILENQTIYKISIVKILIGGNEQEIYSTHFRTSAYNTFLQKMSNVTNTKGYSWSEYTGSSDLKMRFDNQPERFDEADNKVDSLSMPGFNKLYYSVGLVQAEALNGKMFDRANEFIYKDYLSSDLRLTWRSIESVSLIPTRAIYITTAIKSLSQLEINQNALVQPANIMNELICKSSVVIMLDWADIRNRAYGHPERETNPYLVRLTSEYLSTMPVFEDYRIKLSYTLPGKKIVTSQKEVLLDFKY